jgi:hypothetical protein
LNISLDTVDKLLVLSAQKETHYQWQSNIQDVRCNGPSINLAWKGHFRNTFHEDNKLLNAINSFSIGNCKSFLNIGTEKKGSIAETSVNLPERSGFK